MSKTTILVTGGAGLIGLETCNQLNQRDDIEVRLFDLPEQVLRARKAIAPGIRIFYGSILDSSSLRDAMDGCDYVIHLAAMLGVRRTERARLRCLETNIEGTRHVLESVIQHRVKKIVFASSSEVYGEPLYNPVDENAPTYGKSVYAVSKLAGEELVMAYAQRYDWLKFTVLRYFNTYGPYQTAQFVIPRFVLNVMHGEAPVIHGDGTQKRSYAYVSDVAAGTIKAALNDSANGQVFNVGNGERIATLWSLAETVISVVGKDGQIAPVQQPDFNFTDRTADREIMMRYCDTSKAREVLGYVPQVSLEDGIRQMVESRAIFENWETGDQVYLQDIDMI